MNLLALAMYREVEGYIRIGDPPIMKETSDRLIGMGLSDDEAIGLICKATVVNKTRIPSSLRPNSRETFHGTLRYFLRVIDPLSM
jgi:hypothetical protein